MKPTGKDPLAAPPIAAPPHYKLYPVVVRFTTPAAGSQDATVFPGRTESGYFWLKIHAKKAFDKLAKCG